MEYYNLLKQKIQDSIPSLKELNNGSIIESPHFNIFSNKYEDDIFDVYTIYFSNVYDEDGNIICNITNIEKHFDLRKCKYGKEPMLNDVLNYLACQTSVITVNGFKNQLHYIISEWDLSNPYLKEQNEDLINYLLGLK